MLTEGKDFEYFNPLDQVKIARANLPHWHQKQALYFVTFRLADSVPQEKLLLWRTEFDAWLRRNPKPWDEAQLDEYQTHFARNIEHWLDQAHGSCLFKNDECSSIVTDCLLKFDGDRYQLDCFTVAANHVHALLVVQPEQTLPEILKSWKGVSARRINQLHNQEHSIWQKETYDHIVRNAASLQRIRTYIQKHDKQK